MLQNSYKSLNYNTEPSESSGSPYLDAHVSWLHILAELLVVVVALAEQADTQPDVVTRLLIVPV